MLRSDRPPLDPEGVPAEPLGRSEIFLLVGVLLFGVVLRFVATSDLWLDEALSVHIARLGPGEIVDALRQDGHPPLYYFVLHGWMNVVGESDLAVRALSGLCALATLPLAWLLGTRRRGPVAGAAAVLVLAVLPFAARYATEARMYALLMLLVAGGWALIDAVLDDEAGWPALVGIVLVAAAMLYTHYWSMWILAATGTAVLICAWRSDGRRRRASLSIAGAMVVGALMFIPWVPVMADQLAHTGTPWGDPQRPSMSAAVALMDFAGGTVATEAVLGAVLLALLVLASLTARADGTDRLAVHLRTVPGIRPAVLAAVAALSLGTCVSWVSGATFASRYAAIVAPVVAVAAGLGIATMPTRGIRLIASTVTVVMLGGASVIVAVDQRTQGTEVASAVDAGAAPGDIVIVCPDQLGPAFSHTLDADVTVLTHPLLTGPDRVDWRDYGERNEAADPQATADAALAQADGRAVWLVWYGGYNTYGAQCEAIRTALATVRTPEIVVVARPAEVFEPMWLERFVPAT